MPEHLTASWLAFCDFMASWRKFRKIIDLKKRVKLAGRGILCDHSQEGGAKLSNFTKKRLRVVLVVLFFSNYHVIMLSSHWSIRKCQESAVWRLPCLDVSLSSHSVVLHKVMHEVASVMWMKDKSHTGMLGEYPRVFKQGLQTSMCCFCMIKVTPAL